MILSAVLAAVTLAPTQSESAVLIRHPKVGEKTSYKVSMTFRDGKTDLVIRGKATEEITRVDGPTFVVLRQLGDTVLVMNGQEQKIEDHSALRIVQLENGQIVDLIRDRRKPEDFRLANLTQLIVPKAAVQVGTKWTVDLAASATTGLRKSLLKFEVLNFGNVGGEKSCQVMIDSEELEGKDPISCRGSFWISPTSGRVLKSSLTVRNAPLGDGKPGQTVVTEQEINP